MILGDRKGQTLKEGWQKLLAVYASVGASVVVFLVGRSVQSVMCPSNSILTGWVGTGWALLGGMLAITFSVLTLFISLRVAKIAELRTGKKVETWRKLCFPGVLFALSAWLWLYGVSSHFCATDRTFTIHGSFFADSSEHSWTQVAAAEPNCWHSTYSKRGLIWNDQLVLIMRDGSQLELGFANEKVNGKEAAVIAKIFSSIPLGGTWSPACYSEFRNLFGKRI